MKLRVKIRENAVQQQNVLLKRKWKTRYGWVADKRGLLPGESMAEMNEATLRCFSKGRKNDVKSGTP